MNPDKNHNSDLWDIWDYDSSDHENIAKKYIPYIVESLKERYGDRYTEIEYEAIAWSGLGDIEKSGKTITNAWKRLSDSKKKELQNAFENVNKDCKDDDCK